MNEHSKHFVKHLTLSSIILLLIISILHVMKWLPVFWLDKTIFLFLFSLTLFTILIFFEIKENHDFKIKKSKTLEYVKNLFFLFIIVLSIHQFYPLWVVKRFGWEIIFASISFGFLTCFSAFNSNYDYFARKKEFEKNIESRRLNDFEIKFNKLNSIPILGRLSKRLYCEGIFYILVLFLLFIVAFLLRAYHAGDLGLVVDEPFTYSVAQNIVGKFNFLDFNNNYYYRGWPYTLLVAFSFLLFGDSEFSLRLVGIIIGSLTPIVLYLVVRKIYNKNLGLWAAFLLTFFAWYIFYSRWGRHYILASFFIILSTYYTYLYFKSNKVKFAIPSFVFTALMVLTLKELLIIPVLYLLYGIILCKFRIMKKDLLWIVFYSLPIAITL